MPKARTSLDKSFSLLARVLEGGGASSSLSALADAVQLPLSTLPA